MSEALQHIIIAIVVLLALAGALRHLAPKTARRCQQALARGFGRLGLRAFARWLAPRANTSGGCSSCTACDAPAQKSAQPLSFHPPRS